MKSREAAPSVTTATGSVGFAEAVKSSGCTAASVFGLYTVLILGFVNSSIGTRVLATLEVTGHLRFTMGRKGRGRFGIVVKFIPRPVPVWLRRALLAASVVETLAGSDKSRHRYVEALELIGHRLSVDVLNSIVVHCTCPEVARAVEGDDTITTNVKTRHR